MLRVCIFFLLSVSSTFAQEYGWGTTLQGKSGKVKIGGRLQVVLDQDGENESQDLYLRRTRVNLEYKPWDGHTFVYDIRNDGANKSDKGEQTFNIGDAYWKIDVNKNTMNNIKLFRAKVDVSYSQTSSSKNLFNPERAQVAEHASDFVVENRRAVNVQINGNVERLAYQMVISDGVNSKDLSALKGEGIAKVNYQKLTYGSKLRYFFIGDAKKNKSQDTFYGLSHSLSLGLGHFRNDKINVDNSNNSTALQEFSLSRDMTNVELSYSHYSFRLLAEYFEFSGDLIDLEANSKANLLGESAGYYVQAEYVLGKWSPYFIYESFNKNKDQSNSVQVITTLGINYYKKLEAMRFGMAFKKENNEQNIGDNSVESINIYAMLNF